MYSEERQEKCYSRSISPGKVSLGAQVEGLEGSSESEQFSLRMKHIHFLRGYYPYLRYLSKRATH